MESQKIVPREWWREYGIKLIESIGMYEWYEMGNLEESIQNHTICFQVAYPGFNFDPALCAELLEKRLFLQDRKIAKWGDLMVPLKEEGAEIPIVTEEYIEDSIANMDKLNTWVKLAVETVEGDKQIFFQRRRQWELRKYEGCPETGRDSVDIIDFRGVFTEMDKQWEHIPHKKGVYPKEV